MTNTEPLWKALQQDPMNSLPYILSKEDHEILAYSLAAIATECSGNMEGHKELMARLEYLWLEGKISKLATNLKKDYNRPGVAGS